MGTDVQKSLEQRTRGVPRVKRRTVPLNPRLGHKKREFVAFCKQMQKALRNTAGNERAQVLLTLRNAIPSNKHAPVSQDDVALMLCCSVLVDVVAQGWAVRIRKKGVELIEPAINEDPLEAKDHVRRGLLMERDAQLREPAVEEFVKSLEQRRLFKGKWHSIFSLMRDGRQLSEQLSAIAALPEKEAASQLASAVDPYIQFVDAETRCDLTNIRLIEIWRYFRHTWVNPYNSLPGRVMMLLVRDAASPNHPVIGIAALGSSMAQQTGRDIWIGWDSDAFLKRVIENPSLKWWRWQEQALKRLFGAIYVKDFLAEGIFTRSDLTSPNLEVIKRLSDLSVAEARLHRQNPQAAYHKSQDDASLSGVDWRNRTAKPLFRSKRAKTLASLLQIRMTIKRHRKAGSSHSAFEDALKDKDFRTAFRQIVRFVKSEQVGVSMMDIIVCGAVAPYNALLGGKLICLLMFSPEVVRHYEKRYAQQVSLIASAVKGAPVIRTPKLVMLGTTSLYGVGSSQYNRIKLEAGAVGGKKGELLQFVELGASRGFGSYHFSELTVQLMDALFPRGHENRKVNSIFGEGVNPLMRKIRDALAAVDLPADHLLMHGNKRVVYGVPLAKNFRDVLLGITQKPQYLIPLTKGVEGTKSLANYWHNRWLQKRIQRQDVLAKVAEQTLAYPINHGARVCLPADENQSEPF